MQYGLASPQSHGLPRYGQWAFGGGPRRSWQHHGQITVAEAGRCQQRGQRLGAGGLISDDEGQRHELSTTSVHCGYVAQPRWIFVWFPADTEYRL